jgi:hypothetical protein
MSAERIAGHLTETPEINAAVTESTLDSFCAKPDFGPTLYPRIGTSVWALGRKRRSRMKRPWLCALLIVWGISWAESQQLAHSADADRTVYEPGVNGITRPVAVNIVEPEYAV